MSWWSYLKNHSRTLLLAIPSTIAIVGCLWRTIKRYPSTIIMIPTEENQFVIDQCPSFHEYRPTPWIFNGHFMTILGVLFRSLPEILFQRILLPVDEIGGTVAIDWHTQPYHGQPILLILHGLTGGSDNEYIRWMTLSAYSKLQICCVVVHARGCGRSQLTSPRLFCAANTNDLRRSIKYIRSVIGNETPIFAVGYSLGAGILTKYLGEENIECPLDSAIICCASFDMLLSTANMEQWLYTHTYNRRLTNNLIRYMRQHEHHFIKSESLPNLNIDQAYQSKTIRDFDRHIVVPQYGFRDVEHYYSEASSGRWVKSIRIPTLILSAIDDPICPIDGLPIDDILHNPYLIAIKTLEGGHVSYLQGWWPRTYSYDNTVVVDYIKARLKQMNYQFEKENYEQKLININMQ
jgi:predicted alpha/beta-fold hydrolase